MSRKSEEVEESFVRKGRGDKRPNVCHNIQTAQLENSDLKFEVKPKPIKICGPLCG